MLVSTTHKFIFIHVPKTAGISMRKILEPYCDEPVTSEFRRLLSHLPISEDISKARFVGHCTANWARLKYGGKFSDYYKFAVVRNPYDWGVSYYHYKMKVGRLKYLNMEGVTYKQFIKWHQKKLIPRVTQAKHITDRLGNILVDDLLRFEDIGHEIERLGSILNIKLDPLPKVNVTKHKHYSEYYDDETKCLFEKLWSDDINLLGYEFEIN